MHSRVPVSRARRLTDTLDVLPGSKPEHLPVSSSGSGGIGTAVAGFSADNAISVITCYGGGIEGNRSITVGGLKLTYSVHTAPGADPGGNTKDNQDAWAVKEKLSATSDMALFGVFDGHGAEGKAVSHHVTAQLPRMVARSPLCKPLTMESCLSSCFGEANRALRRNSAIDCDLSGSTGIVSVVTAGGKLVVANLGDSRCVAGRVDARGRVTAVPLSSDQTPMDQAEADRVIASGGRIASYMYNDEPLGPPRVWLREMNVPGLCMTRSFGDAVAASVGVIDTPEVLTYSLTKEDRYIVLMSDGIFEFMDSQEVLESVHALALKGHGPNEAAKSLVKEARRRWQQEESDIIDDCTALVIHVTHQPAAAVPGAAAGAPAAAGAGGRLGALAGRLEAGLRIGGSSSGASASSAPGAGGSGSSGSGSGSGSSGSGAGGAAGARGSTHSKAAAGALGYGRR